MITSDAAGAFAAPIGSQDPRCLAASQGGPCRPVAIPQYRRFPLSWRDARFVCILLAIVFMSLADLTMTLVHATSIGMVEENPIARILMRYGGICSICAWKAGTVAVGIFILWRIRRFPTAEIGAWICFVILAALCFHWARYNTQVSQLTNEILSLEKSHQAPDWVVMDPRAIQ